MTEPPVGIVAALVAFQAALPRVEKTSTAQYGAYADLADVSGIVLPRLAQVGIAYTAWMFHTADGEHWVLRAQLRHVSGETIDCDWPIALTGPQQMGSAFTYARRYCLLAMCGVHPAGEDDDAQLAAKEHQKLARDTVKTSKRATRTTTTRGQDDPWTVDPTPARQPTPSPAAAGPDPIPDTSDTNDDPDGVTAAQLKMIGALMSGKGIRDRESALEYVTAAIGRPVQSRKDLSRAEATHLIDALQYDDRPARGLVDIDTGELT